MSIPFIPAPRSSLEWAESKRSGVVSELSLLTSIKPGLVPGERRTYEERLRDHLESLQLGGGRERGLLFMAASAPNYASAAQAYQCAFVKKRRIWTAS